MRLTPNEIIPENECWDLLKRESVGRVALSVAALPAIVPVGYSVDGAELTITLDAHETIPEKALDDAIVAFEVDTIDSANHTGWIVHVIGSAHMTERTTAATAPNARFISYPASSPDNAYKSTVITTSTLTPPAQICQ